MCDLEKFVQPPALCFLRETYNTTNTNLVSPVKPDVNTTFQEQLDYIATDMEYRKQLAVGTGKMLREWVIDPGLNLLKNMWSYLSSVKLHDPMSLIPVAKASELEEDSRKKFLIVGINKVDLLLSLYNNAHCQGKVFDSNPVMKSMGRMSASLQGKREKAEKLIDSGQTSFGYIDLGAGSRPMKISLDIFDMDITSIDTTSYDKYNGEGLGKRVIEAIIGKTIKDYATETKKPKLEL